MRAPSGAESLGPRVRQVRLQPAHVDGLHRRGHALGRETGDGRIGRGLDVFDAVTSWSCGKAGVGVEHFANGAVADGVGGDAQFRVMHSSHCAPVLLDVGPHGTTAVALGIGLLEPGGAGVDDPVEHELHPVGAPLAPRPHGPAGDRLNHRLIGRRVHPVVQRNAHIESAVTLELFEKVCSFDAPIHEVHARDAHGILARDRVAVPANAFVMTGDGHRYAHRVNGRPLVQFTRGTP